GFDTAVGRLEFVTVKTRTVIDLPGIDASEMTPEALAASLRENARWLADEMPIVRQRVFNVHSDTRGRLGSAILRELNGECLNYLLRLLPPQIQQDSSDHTRSEA